jgi:hypothetical protein
MHDVRAGTHLLVCRFGMLCDGVRPAPGASPARGDALTQQTSSSCSKRGCDVTRRVEARSALMRYRRSWARVRFRLGIIRLRLGLGGDWAAGSGSVAVVMAQSGNSKALPGRVV